MEEKTTSNRNSLREEAMKIALETLSKELKTEPLSPEKLVAISTTISTLDKINILLF